MTSKASRNEGIVSKVIMYAFNYDHKFIAKAFADDENLANHFQAKFSSFYSRFGNGEQAFLYLYTAMTSDNRATLVEWIDTNFKG